MKSQWRHTQNHLKSAEVSKSSEIMYHSKGIAESFPEL